MKAELIKKIVNNYINSNDYSTLRIACLDLSGMLDGIEKNLEEERVEIIGEDDPRLPAQVMHELKIEAYKIFVTCIENLQKADHLSPDKIAMLKDIVVRMRAYRRLKTQSEEAKNPIQQNTEKLDRQKTQLITNRSRILELTNCASVKKDKESLQKIRELKQSIKERELEIDQRTKSMSLISIYKSTTQIMGVVLSPMPVVGYLMAPTIPLLAAILLIPCFLAVATSLGLAIASHRSHVKNTIDQAKNVSDEEQCKQINSNLSPETQELIGLKNTLPKLQELTQVTAEKVEEQLAEIQLLKKQMKKIYQDAYQETSASTVDQADEEHQEGAGASCR